MNTHTPGPWRLSDVDNIIYGPNREVVCADGSGAFIAIQNDDDARLIAAAPSLADALAGLLMDIESIAAAIERGESIVFNVGTKARIDNARAVLQLVQEPAK